MVWDPSRAPPRGPSHGLDLEPPSDHVLSPPGGPNLEPPGGLDLWPPGSTHASRTRSRIQSG